jgi:hypothetical protein
MAAMTDYLENKLIDQLFRGQAAPTTTSLYVALFTTAPTDSTPGTEPSGNGYTRVLVASALLNWAGTQSAGSTTASSGASGTTSNNGSLTFPTPTGTWGTVTHFGIFDAATTGNMLFHGSLTISKTINQDDTVAFPAGSLSVTFA